MPVATCLATLAVGGGALSEKLRLENKIVRIVDIETVKMHTTIKLTLIIPPLGEMRGGRCSGAGQFNVCAPPLGRVGCWERCRRSCGRKIKIVRIIVTFEILKMHTTIKLTLIIPPLWEKRRGRWRGSHRRGRGVDVRQRCDGE